MATLITSFTMVGGGGHACDMSHAMPEYDFRLVEHHKDINRSAWWADKVFIGINDPWARARVAEELGINDLPWIHHRAWLGLDCSIGYGTHINYGVTMTRTTIGHHTTISPGVTICGDVTIGDRVFIGAGSTIKNLVSIGDDAFIRMGSIVTRDVEAGERY